MILLSWNENEYTKITDKTINNIPCFKIIRGRWSKRYNENIQNIIKMVLYLSMTRKDEPGNEVGILARIDGRHTCKPIYGYCNKYNVPSISNENAEYQKTIEYGEINKYVFVHNHPNNSVLSINDIKNLLYTPQINTVIAVGNNGEIHYVQKTSKEYNIYEYVLRLYTRYIGKHFCDDVEKLSYAWLVENQCRLKLSIR